MSERPPEFRYKLKLLPNGRCQLDGYHPGGPRERQRFKTYQKACERRDELLTEDCNRAVQLLPKTTWLKAQQLRDAEAAYLILDDLVQTDRWPLCCAAQLAKKSLRKRTSLNAPRKDQKMKRQRHKTVADIKQNFLGEKAKEGCREDTIKNLRSRIGMLSRFFSDTPIRRIRRKALNRVLQRKGISHTTAENDRRAYSSFFSWCMDQEPPLCAENPARRRRRCRNVKDQEDPPTLTNDQALRLLVAAASFKEGKLVPYLVLCMFCGLRPSEAARVPRANIELDRRIIILNGKCTKTRSRRTVEIPLVAIKWLRIYLKPDTVIRSPNWRKDFAQVRRMAGFALTKDVKAIGRWPQNVLRHTAISHRLSETADPKLTAMWAGTSSDVIFRDYWGVVLPSETKKFWELSPRMVLRQKSGAGRH